MRGLETVAIVGAGTWGTALAQTAARAGRNVLLWARDPEITRAIASTRRNPRYLAEVKLDDRIQAVLDLGAVAQADLILLAVPAQQVRAACELLGGGRAPLVICAKGLEQTTELRLSQVAREVCLGRNVAVLSGPNFAREVALGLPAASALGCEDHALGGAIATALSSRHFRVYWTDDIVGVEVGGAVKNVLAIAAGIVLGLGLGENARAALITRGLAEIARLGEALGARRETLAGLSGLGDAILTCTSLTSRNTAFGRELGAGADPRALRTRLRPLAEGVFTAGAAARLAERLRIEMPIVRTVDDILEGRLDVAHATERLMSRPLKMETDASDG